jgi:hypothetical protein
MLGSPMFTKDLNHKSFIQMFPWTKVSPPSTKQLTILGWIRPDAIDEGTVLVLYRNVEMKYKTTQACLRGLCLCVIN